MFAGVVALGIGSSRIRSPIWFLVISEVPRAIDIRWLPSSGLAATSPGPLAECRVLASEPRCESGVHLEDFSAKELPETARASVHGSGRRAERLRLC
jgi:hypothetical protein